MVVVAVVVVLDVVLPKLPTRPFVVRDQDMSWHSALFEH